MNITDVPLSGVYVQQNAIFQIIAQILDLTTGLPVQLQTATGLSIALGYPDGVTAVTLPAFLYTDGSDGMIFYDTLSTDLSQVGLYHFQGNGVINSVQIPPSYEGDFYVLPNVAGTTPSPLFNSSAVILFDSNSVRWAGTVVAGAMSWVAAPSGPVRFFQPTSLVMRDPAGIYWTVTISTLGVVSAVPGGAFANAIDDFILNDINGKSWIVTISEAGILVAS